MLHAPKWVPRYRNAREKRFGGSLHLPRIEREVEARAETFVSKKQYGLPVMIRYVIFLSLAFWIAPQLPAAERPNVIIIMADDMGFSDIGCYGGEIETPTLDHLAENGIRFTQFYNTGRCCPTRASLITGLYPHQAGVGHMMADRKLPGYRGDLGPNTRDDCRSDARRRATRPTCRASGT